MNESTVFVSSVLDALKQLVEHKRASLNGTAESIVARSALQDGMFDELGISVENTVDAQKMRITAQLSTQEHSVVVSLAERWTSEQLQQHFIPALREQITAWLDTQKGDAFWAHTVVVQLLYPAQFGPKLEPHGILLVYRDEARAAALRQRIANYMDSALWQGKHPPKDLDVMFLLQHLVCPQLYTHIDAAQIERACKAILELSKVSPKRLVQVRNSMLHTLKRWANKVFLPRYFETVEPLYGSAMFFSIVPDHDIGVRNRTAFVQEDQASVELLAFIAVLILQFEPSYSRDTGIAYLNQAGELGYQRAYDLLKTGSGLIDPAYTRLTTDEVECLANDVQAQVHIKIRQETASAYAAALRFLSNVLEQGFPHSYQIRLSSKAKAVFPVPKLGKGKTLQFFANAAQYAELHAELERYAEVAMQEYEWYSDQENEYCAMPGSYAVFILALANERYLPLLQRYLQQVDDEHQMVHQQFLKTLLETQGMTTANSAIVVDGIGRVNGDFKAKVASVFEGEQALQLLLEQSRKLDRYAVQTLVYFIWGSEAALRKVHKQAVEPQKALLGELLTQHAQR
ncbi:DUF6138 family protein [Paenalcaligenes suwonensis]|uniref:DUF6138 family protein n=1 Tax=Paenalcaligenes suwonensis TaxID=1202713 RepID=UPI00140DEFC8|nr:DUF6138 family protein [Paenalcaligenes suwonensis]NHC62049.1 hypothetical protein [Paenalcaligenes suwonensis]